MDWMGATKRIQDKIEAYFEDLGWEKNEYGELVGTPDFSDDDIGNYIGERPLSAIMAPGGDRVYGEGVDGVSNFIAETYTTAFEEDFVERMEEAPEGIRLDEEDLEWLENDDVWSEVSSYIQGFVRPAPDFDVVANWVAQQGY